MEREMVLGFKGSQRPGVVPGGALVKTGSASWRRQNIISVSMGI